jgi:hypothetical protein
LMAQDETRVSCVICRGTGRITDPKQLSQVLDLATARVKPEPPPLDCRSEAAVTVGLIDAIISIARVLRRRDLTTTEAMDALEDFRADEDVAFLLGNRQRPREG